MIVSDRAANLVRLQFLTDIRKQPTSVDELQKFDQFGELKQNTAFGVSVTDSWRNSKMEAVSPPRQNTFIPSYLGG